MASMSLRCTAIAALVASVAAADFPSITAKGSKFFYPNGTQFFIKGVAYQQDVGADGKGEVSANFKDPLADEDKCKRDIPLLQQLGTNTIRTYSIDPTADHSACMSMLQDANIYVISDLSDYTQSIDQSNPAWTTDLYERYTSVVDDLAQYPNVIGFFAGNEVANNDTNTNAAAFVKAAVRDTKKYIADKHTRWMGVGYAADDASDIRQNVAHYMNCGSDQSDAVDFYGYNIYSWCGTSSIKQSGYLTAADFFSNYSVPVFFAEYGCNNPGGAAGRKFDDTAALFSSAMTGSFSGGIVFMYFEETNDYGLVKESSNGDSVTKLADFSALQSQIAKVDPKGVSESSYSSSNSPASCPALSDTWKSGSDLPPTPDQSLCDCMVQASSCVPSNSLDSDSYGDIFSYICSREDGKYCEGIIANSTSGVYGAYTMCAAKEKLAYVLDAYYQGQNSDSTACDFNGQAQTQSPSTNSSCKAPLATASAINSAAATATTTIPEPTSVDTDGGNGDDDSFGSPSATITRLFNMGGVGLGLYAVVAAGVGAAVMVL